MTEQNPLTISELISSLKAAKKQFGNLPVRVYTGKCIENRIYTHLCKEPTEIKLMEDREVEENSSLRKFMLIR